MDNRVLLLLDVESVDIDDGEDGMEFEWDDDGGVSNNGKEDNNGSLNFSSVSHSIKSSSSARFMTFLASSSSASIISNVDVCYKEK